MIPTSAEGTMPLIQIQRDCSTTFVILDSAGMDTTVQVWESMIALPFQRVKYTWPPNLLVHKNFDSPFFVFCFSSKTHYLITLIMTYIFLIIYLFFGLIKLSLLQLLHCMLKPLFFLRALGTISWFHCRHRWMCYKYPQLQYGQLRLLQILRDRSIALVVLDIQICRHKNTSYIRITWDSRHWINRRDCVICTSTPTLIPL